jgi:DNA-binding PadR family transcriptional regulator
LRRRLAKTPKKPPKSEAWAVHQQTKREMYALFPRLEERKLKLAGTLSERLEMLEQHGIVKKTVESYMPPRTNYELTEAGVAMQGLVDAIDAWARRYLGQ